MGTRPLFVVTFLVVAVSCHAASLHGSPISLALQNGAADVEELPRISNDEELAYLKATGVLVHLPTEAVKIDPRVPEKFHYVLPQTHDFLVKFAAEFARRFHKKPVVNSAIRTQEYQNQLRSINGNAASSDFGPQQSSHLTGATIDIAKKGLSDTELAWMRRRLLALEAEGAIEATEEFSQLVFHIMVFRVYGEKQHRKKTTSRPRPAGTFFTDFDLIKLLSMSELPPSVSCACPRYALGCFRLY